jgi:aspartate-semialdehyde dehydrogenase
MESVDIAVVGATGAVAEILFEILEERKFPVGKLFALASERSEGDFITFKNKRITVENLANFDFAQTQLAFFSVGMDIAKDYIPKATAAGCVVIDKSNLHRMDPEVPLVVPEVNAHMIKDFKNKNIIANPNCTTIQLVVALKPIQDAAGLERVSIASYQAVSGAGKQGITELAQNTSELLNGHPAKGKVFPTQIAFNVIPQIDVFEENGYTGEEMKIINETKKILENNALRVSATAVRVPVFHGHSEAVQIETKQKTSADAVRKILQKAPGIKVLDKRQDRGYPTPMEHGVGNDDVYVGRIRDDLSSENGICLWVVADNLRKGAALNAVQIAEILVNEYF